MYLLYVDESGDTGHLENNSPTEMFVLSAIVIHELKWKELLEDIIKFRRHLKTKYGLKISEEIHASHFFTNPSAAIGKIDKYKRLQILRDVLNFQASLSEYTVMHVIVDKRKKPITYDVFDHAWTTLLQRFHNTIHYKNFPGAQNAKDFGLVISDNTDMKKLTALVRKLRKFNYVPSQFGSNSRQIPLDLIVEDPIGRDSSHSMIIQFCDVNAYALFQHLRPNKYYRKKGAKNWFKILAPIANKKASSTNNLGVVKI